MSFFKQIFSADKIMDTFYYMLFVSFVLSTMLVTFVWMKNRNQLLQAIAICGFEKRYRYIELFRRYIFVAIEGIVAGIATVYILSKKIDNIILKNEYMINTISCVILFGIIIFLWCYIFNECKDLQ